MKKPKVLDALLGNPKEDFRFKFIPGLIDAAQQRQYDLDPEPEYESGLTREEFAKRYRNIQWSYWILLGFIVFSLVQAVLNELLINQIGALLAAVLMLICGLRYGFRLWVARLVWCRWGKSRNTPMRPLDYLQHCIKSPLDLLPISLPKRPC